MKKRIALILSAILLFSLVSCGETENDDKDSDTNLEFGPDGEINFPIIDAN